MASAPSLGRPWHVGGGPSGPRPEDLEAQSLVSAAGLFSGSQKASLPARKRGQKSPADAHRSFLHHRLLEL